MKKLLSILIMGFAALSVLPAAEPESKTGQIRIHLSRDSQVGTTVIPSGDYKVKVEREQPGNKLVLHLTSESGKNVDLSLSEEQSPKQSSNGQAYTFAGTARVLSKIWFKGESKVYNVTDTAVASRDR
ncbi:MAG TPA: hypothetical protein VGK99_00420 [Acidobacteriota bacterium]